MSCYWHDAAPNFKACFHTVQGVILYAIILGLAHPTMTIHFLSGLGSRKISSYISSMDNLKWN